MAQKQAPIDAGFEPDEEQPRKRDDDDDDRELSDYRIHELTKRINSLQPRRQQFYPVLYDLAPSLLAQSYLDPHARLFHFRGKAQISADRTTDRSERVTHDTDDPERSDGNEVEIIYRQLNAKEIEVRYGDPNPFAQESYLTQTELLQLIEDHTGFEDITIKERGISYRLPEEVRQRLEERDNTTATADLDLSTVYHHEQSIGTTMNQSPMGFETVDVGAEIRDTLQDMQIPDDDLGTIGQRIRAVLKTDYTLVDGPYDHRVLAQNDTLGRLVRNIAANNPWQDVGVPESRKFGSQNIRWYQLENLDGSLIL